MEKQQISANRFTTEEKKAALRDYSASDMTTDEVARKHGVHIATLGGWSMSESTLAKTGFSAGDFTHRRNTRGMRCKVMAAAAPHSQVDGMVTTVQAGGKVKAAKSHKHEEVDTARACFCPKCGTDILAVNMAMEATARRY